MCSSVVAFVSAYTHRAKEAAACSAAVRTTLSSDCRLINILEERGNGTVTRVRRLVLQKLRLLLVLFGLPVVGVFACVYRRCERREHAEEVGCVSVGEGSTTPASPRQTVRAGVCTHCRRNSRRHQVQLTAA